MVKVVYQDGDVTRALKGRITSEDDFFVTVSTTFAGDIRLNKKFIVKIEDGVNDG